MYAPTLTGFYNHAANGDKGLSRFRNILPIILIIIYKSLITIDFGLRRLFLTPLLRVFQYQALKGHEGVTGDNYHIPT